MTAEELKHQQHAITMQMQRDVFDAINKGSGIITVSTILGVLELAKADIIRQLMVELTGPIQ